LANQLPAAAHAEQRQTALKSGVEKSRAAGIKHLERTFSIVSGVFIGGIVLRLALEVTQHRRRFSVTSGQRLFSCVLAGYVVLWLLGAVVCKHGIALFIAHVKAVREVQACFLYMRAASVCSDLL
jgi:hypothetical protein